MSGEQLANVIKQLNPSMPVILLTGFEDLAEDTGIGNSSIDLVVTKPASLEELRRAIFTVLTHQSAELVSV